MGQLASARSELRLQADPIKAAFFPRFFKSGPGEYGEGDKFLGVTVPKTRTVAKQYANLSLDEVGKLLDSAWHEERLLALIILVNQFHKADHSYRQQIYSFYMANTDRVNNWDLVDTSAPGIVGEWLLEQPDSTEILQRLCSSDLLWERRIAVIATYAFIKAGRPEQTLLIADSLLSDRHDLIHKAVGWMLRELGKRIDDRLLTDYLDRNATRMPRTALRYAIERLPKTQQQYYLKLV